MIKSAGKCGFGPTYWRILNGRLHFLCSETDLAMMLQISSNLICAPKAYFHLNFVILDAEMHHLIIWYWRHWYVINLIESVATDFPATKIVAVLVYDWVLYDFSSVIFSSKVNIINYSLLSRSNRPDVFCKKGVLRNFAACNFIKKETLAQVFSCQFCKISKNTFSYRTPLDECF